MPSAYPFQYPYSLELINSIHHLLKRNKGEDETFKKLISIYSKHIDFDSDAGLRIRFIHMDYKSEGYRENVSQIENMNISSEIQQNGSTYEMIDIWIDDAF
mgnify:CR=1 FL=1